MAEIPEQNQIEREKLLFPATLDLIKIDGRWAQVVSSNDIANDVSVKFLDDNTIEERKLGSYKIIRFYNDALVNVELPDMTAQDRLNLYYDPEQKNDPEFTKLIKVFAEYGKK